MARTDYISPQDAVTIPGLLLERVRRTPAAVAYRQYNESEGRWYERTWAEAEAKAARWQAALRNEGYAPGDRVAVLTRNCMEWVFFDQAALACGLVVVPLFLNDSAASMGHILNNSGARMLLVEDMETWDALGDVRGNLPDIERVVIINPARHDTDDGRIRPLVDWLPSGDFSMETTATDPDALASIVYTSGTTGLPKGVMLSHRNMLANAYAGLQAVEVYPSDHFLSFLPLCHTFERTIGYYLPVMAGATVSYARSVKHLRDDMAEVRPTILVSVPLIFQRIYDGVKEKLEGASAFRKMLFGMTVTTGWEMFLFRQKRQRVRASAIIWPLLKFLVARKVLGVFGGRLRLAVSGGAPLPKEVGGLFLSMGLPLLQGYGLTETSPVISVNRVEDNDHESVGRPLPGVEVSIREDNGEILVKGDCVTAGYWNDPEATRKLIKKDGWLHTGDVGEVREGKLYITDRAKQIIVMSTGKKVPPAEIEKKFARIPLFRHAIAVGERRPYLSAVISLEPAKWGEYARGHGADPERKESLSDPKITEGVVEIIDREIPELGGYAKIRKVILTLDEWTVAGGLLTPTLKTRRARIIEHYGEEIEALYAREKGGAL